MALLQAVAHVLIFALEMSSSQCRLFLVGRATVVVVTTVSRLGGTLLTRSSLLLQEQVLLGNLLVPISPHVLGARHFSILEAK
jgi:hypothetical protein